MKPYKLPGGHYLVADGTRSFALAKTVKDKSRSTGKRLEMYAWFTTLEEAIRSWSQDRVKLSPKTLPEALKDTIEELLRVADALEESLTVRL